jgi:hypothetical protein
MQEIKTIPKIQDLYSDKENIQANDSLMVLLNQPPLEKWIKEHPFIKNYKYLPIDKIEYLLKRIFKKYKIEILREGTSFNGVYVVVRVWYLDPISNEYLYHDGIGACQLQTKQGTTPADLANINNGALQMAFPIAKTIAIKDACDHFGTLFGSDLNRKDTLKIDIDEKLKIKKELLPNNNIEWNDAISALKSGKKISDIEKYYTISDENKLKLENDSI